MYYTKVLHHSLSILKSINQHEPLEPPSKKTKTSGKSKQVKQRSARKEGKAKLREKQGKLMNLLLMPVDVFVEVRVFPVFSFRTLVILCV
jgi:hypothetical protein